MQQNAKINSTAITRQPRPGAFVRTAPTANKPLDVHLPAPAVMLLHAMILAPLAIFLCFYNLDTAPIWGSYTAVDEGRHIRVAQEMWLTGKWWLPTLDGAPYFLKPPFKMWLTLIPAHLLGESNFSYRCIDAALGVALVGLIYFFGTALFRSMYTGLFAALFLLGNQIFFFVHGLRNAVQDTMMLFLTSIVMYLGYKFLEDAVRVQVSETQFPAMPEASGASASSSSRYSRNLTFIAGTLTGIAVMTKSAAGFYPLPLLAAFAICSGAALPVLRLRFRWVLLLTAISLLIPALYYVPHFLFTESAFSGAVQHEILNRFDTGFHNQQKTDFYWRLLKGGSLIAPYPLFLSAIYFAVQAVWLRSKPHLFVLLWAAIPVVVFSMLPSRLAWYLAPCYLPFALMVGETTVQACKEFYFQFNRFKSGPFKTVPARLAIILMCFTFLTTALIKGTRSIATTAATVSVVNPTVQLQPIAEAIVQRMRKLPADSRILACQMPQVSSAESTYFNMLKPYLEVAPDEKSFQQLLATGRYAFALASLDSAKEVLDTGNPPKYTVLGPEEVDQGWLGHQRTEPLVVFATGDTSGMDQFFHPPLYSTELVKLPGSKLHFGWSHKTFGHLARIMVGSGSAFYLSGDLFLEKLGANMTIRLARSGDSTAPGMRATLVVNSRIVGEIEDIPADFKRFRFEVPPDTFHEGERNFVELLVRNADGKPIADDQRTLLVSDVVLKPHMRNRDSE